MRWLAAIAACTALVVPATAQACSSTAAYSSVVLNQEPTDIPDDATVYRVRIEDGYVVTRMVKTTKSESTITDIQGISGHLLDEGTASEGDAVATPRSFAIKARLGSMCDTWYEVWSADHDVREGKLYGYIVGKPVGEEDGTLMLWPMLYRSAEDRERIDSYNPGSTHGDWLQESERNSAGFDPRRYEVHPGGEWKPIRFDAKAMGQVLPQTNRAIRKGIQKLDRERANEE